MKTAARPTLAKKTREDSIAPEYDFRGGVRGKYSRRFAEGSNVVVLDPDVARVFPDSVSVNEALRALAHIAARKGARARTRRAAQG